MHPFVIDRAGDPARAIALAAQPGAEYIAGGTDLMQLLKDEVRRPHRLVDLEGLKLDGIEAGPEGLKIGAMVRMSDLADHPDVARNYPVIAEALLASAAPQIRNLATIGGNLLQRTRCTYFRDAAEPCNKREPGSGCAALGGVHRIHAIMGGSPNCVATHASDLAVALVVLDAVVHLAGVDGAREVALADFHVLPGDHPEIETVMKPGELIAAISVPPSAWAGHSHYLKARDRASFEFALASAAVALDIAEGKIRNARIAVGGVGTKPWRLPAVEQALTGAPATDETWQNAGEIAIRNTAPLTDNAFKVPLLKAIVRRALEETGASI